MSPSELAQAQLFITALTGSVDTPITIQTFDDKGERRKLARVLHGTLTELAETLVQLSKAGAGVFLAVNETDGQGRKAANVRRVRALFADFDGVALPERWALEPHIIVQSSPGRYHAYWLLSDIPLELFSTLQVGLATIYGSDPAVKDLSRVMRLPGFRHQKQDAYSVTIHALRADLSAYKLAEVLAAMPELERHLEAARGARAAKAQRQATPRQHSGGSSERVKRLLDAHYDAVAAAVPGGRHELLVRHARTLGGYVGSGAVSYQEAYDTLTDAAAACGLPQAEAAEAIRWGLEAGSSEPLELEPRAATFDTVGAHDIHQQVTGRYFDALELQPGVTCLQGQMGTGKTEAVSRWLSQHPEMSTLALSHLQALTGTLATRLELTDYRDIPKGCEGNVTRAAYCVNSLHRLAGGGQVAAVEVLFIDEIEQLLERLTSRKDFERKRECLAVLEYLTRAARYVVVADAHLSSTTINWLERLRPQDAPELLRSSYRPADGRTLYLHAQRGDVRAEALAALRAGRRVYYTANSKKQAAALHRWLLAEAGLADADALLVTSQTAGEHDVLAFFKRPSSEAARYQLVVASPSVSTGVSIDAPTAFDVVCGEYTAQVGTPYDAMQALSRVRQTAETHVWLGTSAGRRPTDKETISRGFWDLLPGETSQDTELADIDPLTGKLTVQASYIQLYLDVKARTNAARNDYRSLFLKLAEAAGFIIAEGAAHADARENVKVAREAADAARVEAVVQAEAISDSDAEALRRKTERQTLTQVERNKLERHAIAAFYRIDISDSEALGVVAAQDKDGERRRHILRLELTQSDAETVQKMMHAQVGALAPDVVRHDHRADAYRHTLQAVGIDSETLQTGGAGYTADDLRARWIAPLAQVWNAYAGTVPGWPSLSYAQAQPVKALGGVLRAVGLRHQRTGDSGAGMYQVNAERLLELREICNLRAEQTDVLLRHNTSTSVCKTDWLDYSTRKSQPFGVQR